jgi:hypothetical protein
VPQKQLKSLQFWFTRKICRKRFSQSGEKKVYVENPNKRNMKQYYQYASNTLYDIPSILNKYYPCKLHILLRNVLYKSQSECDCFQRMYCIYSTQTWLIGNRHTCPILPQFCTVWVYIIITLVKSPQCTIQWNDFAESV